MTDIMKKIVMLSLAVFLMALSHGCVSKTVEVRGAPDCREAIASDLADVSDLEIKEMLDEAWAESNHDLCWTPLVQTALEERRAIPAEHLRKAVHELNQRQTSEIFHKAVVRYLTYLAQEREVYTNKDRRLLESYCRWAINNARSRSDQKLQQARNLCKRLDTDLYRKLFI